MLNISNNDISKHLDIHKFSSSKEIFNKNYHKKIRRFLLIATILLVVVLFLPWTQNINSKGNVTTLKPSQRPQTLQSQIPGRIEQWFVQEGNFVKRGDTILRISEIKSDYFDDKLTERTGNQIDAKSSVVTAYKNKVGALQQQIKSLQQERVLKLEQAQNKLLQSQLKAKTDSIDLEAIKIKADVAKSQYERTVSLQKEGLKAVRDVEDKQAKHQEVNAKLISQRNKYLTSKNNIINSKLAISTIDASYGDKLSKAQSNLFTAQSNAYKGEADVSKLETNLANYQKRNSLLFITAPQNGYINKAIKSGIGETFKEGEQLVSIMPADIELAVEMYVKPIDLPLIHIGEDVRVQFDGWPAIVFSGWPNASQGTYGAKIVAIENFISDNGMYRVLISPDKTHEQWPKALRVGSGARTITLLENVPIWYELWRQINSFPPNFYQPKSKKSPKTKKKK